MSSSKSPESHHAYAHRQALKAAIELSDPMLAPREFAIIYWDVMAGYGFRPYVRGWCK